MNKMKKLFYLSFIFFLVANITFGQKKRVAVVTFYADKYINANKIEEGSRQATYEKTKEDDPRFDLRPILEEFHETFMKKYVKEFPFEVVPENDIISNPMYMAYKGLDGIEDQDEMDDMSEAINDRFIAIDGYNVLLTGGNMLRSWRTESHLVKILEDENIDGVLFVSMSYAWEPKIAFGGLGNAGIRSYINMDLFDKEAKKVFKLEEFATSKKGVALVSGAPILNYDKLMPMCKNATEELLDDLSKKLPKYVKKVDKKL
jgi:hypothetical protein